LGTIEKIDGNLFTISHDFDEVFSLGDSMALSGMCTTVLKSDEKRFVVEIMEESRRRTTFGAVSVGDFVNLERPAKIGARNSGHFVTGHIDETGEILEKAREGDYWRFRISVSDKNAPLIVEKGSIAIDGTSMTISKISPRGTGDPGVGHYFEVCVISHTFEHTLFGKKSIGDNVNLEYDILGKYILRAEELSGL
ncbi:riboflavin synthase, partial [Candidatus Gracilibacteria bacterium]|nr:riboflavin synthase [Candidatus Gracilibacteria bacterium]